MAARGHFVKQILNIKVVYWSEMAKNKQEASRPDSSAIYNWLFNYRKFTQSEIRSSQSRFEHY